MRFWDFFDWVCACLIESAGGGVIISGSIIVQAGFVIKLPPREHSIVAVCTLLNYIPLRIAYRRFTEDIIRIFFYDVMRTVT